MRPGANNLWLLHSPDGSRLVGSLYSPKKIFLPWKNYKDQFCSKLQVSFTNVYPILGLN